MECLHPGPDTGLEKNAASLVFRLKVRGLSVLLTGDLENEGEEMLVQSGIQHADILKVGLTDLKTAQERSCSVSSGQRLPSFPRGKRTDTGIPTGRRSEG